MDHLHQAARGGLVPTPLESLFKQSTQDSSTKDRIIRLLGAAGCPLSLGLGEPNTKAAIVFMPDGRIEELLLGQYVLKLIPNDDRVRDGFAYKSEDAEWLIFLYLGRGANGDNVNQMKVAIYHRGVRFPYPGPPQHTVQLPPDFD